MKRNLLGTSGAFTSLMVGLWAAPVASVHAADEICTFKTNDAHYATLTSPGEPIVFKWRKSTGKVSGFKWLHGGVTWFSFAAQRGTVLPDGGFPADYHLRVNLGITTAGYEPVRYEIRGYLEPNISLPNATFAGVYEGTGTAWIVAYGELSCVAVP